MARLATAALLLAALSMPGWAEDGPAPASRSSEIPADPPEELGTVAWLHSLRASRELAVQTGKPILVLFQQVPGCITCKTYGRQVLGHPLVADAIVDQFIPLRVLNNTRGDADERMRHTFKEPAWNNPVVRFVDAEGRDLAPRLAQDHTVGGLLEHVVRALDGARKPIPPYLALLAREAVARQRGVETVALATACLATGEARLGLIEGVLATRPGRLGGDEIVEVVWDPQALAFDRLLRQADGRECAVRVFTRTDEQQRIAEVLVAGRAVRTDEPVTPEDGKHHLGETPYRHLPMTAAQFARVNALLAEGSDPARLLAPAQRRLLEMIAANPDVPWPIAVGRPFGETWAQTREIAASLVE
jgi:hypothetical protein